MPTPAELFEAMPANIDAAKIGDLDATVVFDLSGDEGGQWAVTLSEGKCTVNDGATDDATATIKMDAGDYVDMVSGSLNPMTAFMTGKVQVDGDLGTVMKMQSLFGM